MTTMTAPTEEQEALAYWWLIANGYTSVEDWAYESDLVYHHASGEWYVLDCARGIGQDPWSHVVCLITRLLEAVTAGE